VTSGHNRGATERRSNGAGGAASDQQVLMNPMAPDKQFAALESEIAGEKAASLGRAGAKLEESLLALRAFDETPPANGAGAQREELAAHAAERLWFYVVQRDACGFHDHREAFELYQVPEEILARMGPRRR
jgi:hypothetical protein